MTKRVHAIKHEAGFTLIEVMVAIFILLIGVLGATTLLNTANAETERNQARNGATNLVRDVIEAARALPYDDVNPTKTSTGATDNTIITALQNMQPTTGASNFTDQDSVASGWQIIRRGITYAVTVQSCVVDDAKDKVVTSHGTPAADGSGYYCPDLPATPTGDANGDDYRRIRVTASWTSNSCNSCSRTNQTVSPRTYSVTQTSIIVNPTGGLGPPGIGPPSFSNVTDCHTATISQTFPQQAVGAVFTVSDPASTTFNASVPVVDATTGNKTFSFTYNAQPPDNTYRVDIQGFDSSGRGGPPVTTFLYINCQEPPDVSGVNGGFDWRRCTNYPVLCASGDRIFDLDWNPSPDRDVVGYYVWRVDNNPDFNGPDPGHADTKVACISRGLQPPNDTTTIPGPIDFLEPFQPACYDTGLQDALNLSLPPLQNILNGRTGSYWLQAVDMQPASPPNPTVAPTQVRQTLTHHSPVFTVTENMLNVRPTPPVLSLVNDNGQPCLSWTDSTDALATGGTILNPVLFYRIYRDSTVVANVNVTVNSGGGSSVSVQVPDLPYKDRIGRATPNAGHSCDAGNPAQSWFEDGSAPAATNYWVTAVDQNYLESFASNAVNWVAP